MKQMIVAVAVWVCGVIIETVKLIFWLCSCSTFKTDISIYWVGTTPGLCPGFCNLSTSFVFTAYSYVPKASNDKTKVDTWVHLGQQPQKTFNTPTVNSLTPVWPLFCQHPVPFSVLFFTFPFFYSDIYISRYERMIFCLLWFEQKTHTLKHNTITVMG